MCYSFTSRSQLNRLPVTVGLVATANSGNCMLSNRTLGQFFMIQSLCAVSVRADLQMRLLVGGVFPSLLMTEAIFEPPVIKHQLLA